VNNKVLNHIISELLNSNTFYWVNGSPEMRYMRIKEYAYYLYHSMPIEQWENILKKVQNKK